MAVPHNNPKAVLLVGGLGTRLKPVVSSVPKPLAPVGDRPFVELLVRQLRNQGIQRLVLCTGYLAQNVENEMGDGRKWDVTIEYSKELHPLGTAGAIRLAEPLLRNEPDFLVLNGDSFFDVRFRDLIDFHRNRKAIASLSLVQLENKSRYGTVKISADGCVSGFKEKTDSRGFVNAGVYVFRREILDLIPPGPVSLEKDIFPNILGRGVYGMEQQGIFIDIGTPEDFALAQEQFSQLYLAANRKGSVSGAT